MALVPFGIDASPSNPLILKLAEDGVTAEVVMAAFWEAKRSKKNEPFGLAYVISIIGRLAREHPS